MSSLSPQVGMAGSTATVYGGNFAGPVELRWNSVNGPLLATGVDGASFSVPVTIPADAVPGVSYVVALQRNPAGAVVGKVSHTFEAIASPTSEAASAPSVATGLWPGSSSSTPSLTGPPAPATTPSTLPVGAGLLAVGLVAIFAGFAIAEGGRRRASASRTSSD